jgi:hypothetical protein
LPWSTYTGFGALCSNIKSRSDEDVATAVAYGRRIKFYPLSQADNPPPTKFADAIDVLYDATILYDQRFYPVDGRAVMYSIAYFSAKHLGAGPVLSVCDRGQGGPTLGGWQYLQPQGAGEGSH